jgi:hypothetical protein
MKKRNKLRGLLRGIREGGMDEGSDGAVDDDGGNVELHVWIARKKG